MMRFCWTQVRSFRNISYINCSFVNLANLWFEIGFCVLVVTLKIQRLKRHDILNIGCCTGGVWREDGCIVNPLFLIILGLIRINQV